MPEALLAAIVASLCGVVALTRPPVLNLVVPQLPIVGIVLTIGLLGALGCVLAMRVLGSPFLWSTGLMADGLLGTTTGIKRDIIG